LVYCSGREEKEDASFHWITVVGPQASTTGSSCSRRAASARCWPQRRLKRPNQERSPPCRRLSRGDGQRPTGAYGRQGIKWLVIQERIRFSRPFVRPNHRWARPYERPGEADPFLDYQPFDALATVSSHWSLTVASAQTSARRRPLPVRGRWRHLRLNTCSG